MNLHEYQAKEILKRYKINVPNGYVCSNINELKNKFSHLKNNKGIIKAQIHSGGRGKAGGVKIFSSYKEAEENTKKLLNKYLVTHQTDKKGKLVSKVLVEDIFCISQELYFSILLDREKRSILIIFSTQGGMDIEESDSSKTIKYFIYNKKIYDYQCREIFFKSKLNIKYLKYFIDFIKKAFQCFIDNDMSLLEINPLVIDTKDNIICLDAKIIIDDNALYRNKELYKYFDESQDNIILNKNNKSIIEKYNLSYIPLDGNIGCIVNGAGLAMATMDLIKILGGNPANFLDIGGDTDSEKVKEALNIILSDNKIKVIFINIFGGIVRCDFIADGIIKALKDIDNINIPVFIIRLQGNNCHIAINKLNNSNLKIKIFAEENFSQAAKLAVQYSK